LTIIIGEPGTGKSLFARAIGRSCMKKLLYACCESLADYPKEDSIRMNYTRFLPKWDKAIDEFFGTALAYDADIGIIDSVTTFLSETTKAVEEADVRPGVFQIAKLCDRQIPIIAISQMRGSGAYMYPAGGQAVSHAASLLIKMNRIKIDNHWIAERFGRKEGEILWTLEVIKDKEGAAVQHKEFEVNYDKELKFPTLTEVERKKEKEENSGKTGVKK